MAKLTFDAANVEPAGDYEAIPPGRYNLMIIDSDMVPTKKGDGHYLKLTFKILEGNHAGRLLWSNLNLDNPNTKAVEIAQRELSAICRAIDLKGGVEEDTEELHNIPLSAQVKIRPEQNGYPASNTVSGFKETIELTEDDAPPWEG